MNRRFFLPVLSASLFLFASSGAAQSTATQAGTLKTEDALVLRDRERRVTALSGAVIKEETLTRQWTADRKDFTQKRETHRLECRQQLRKANKAQILPTLARCIGSDLTWENDLLLKQKTYLVALPDISEPARKAVSTSLDQYRDAISTIARGIDANVFGSREELLESLSNLHGKYRLPFHSAWLRATLDRALSHSAMRISRIDRASVTGSGAVLTPPERTCIADAEAHIRTSLKGTTFNSKDTRTLLLALENCTKSVVTGSGSVAH